MHEQEPSRTAFAAAAHRAAHQVIEHGFVFKDPLAVPVLGVEPEALVRDAEARPGARGMRFFIAARSAFAESMLAEGVAERGVRQAVVLGAGLDTFAYRNPFGDRLKVFEVDHPATQIWKQRRLAEAGIAVPPSLVYAPVNFERERLADGLAEAGFDPQRRTFFLWLGVVPYLTAEAVRATLDFIGGLPGGGEVVFDYAEPPGSMTADMRARHEERAARVAAVGEPFLSYFEPAMLRADLEAHGFTMIEDLGLRALAANRLGPDAPAVQAMPEGGGHVVLAATA